MAQYLELTTHPVVRAIEVSHPAHTDQVRRNPLYHSWRFVCLIFCTYLELAGPRKLAVELDALVDQGIRDVVDVIFSVVDFLTIIKA